jgi:hypothetical protein
MADPTAPAPAVAAPAAAPTPTPTPTPTPNPLEGTAGTVAARMRARAGLPALGASGVPDPKAVPNPAAPAAGTPTVPSTSEPPATDKPDETKPPEPKKNDGALALELVREQKARRAAEQRATELEQRVKAGESESAAGKTAKEKWAAGQFADAIRESFGVKSFSDDFLVQLARADIPSEPLTPEQFREQVREQLKAEMAAEREARETEIAGLREAAVAEVGETFTKTPGRWPTLEHYGVSSEQIGAQLDTNRNATPEQIFDELEKAERARHRAYWQKHPDAEAPPPPAADPPPPTAPRSFGSESRRGPVPTTEPVKPQTAEERWEARRKANEEWKRKQFAPRN